MMQAPVQPQQQQPMFDANGHPIFVQQPQVYVQQPQVYQPQYVPQPQQYAQQQQQQGGKGGGKSKTNVRVQFMVVRVLDAGWGFGSDDPLNKKSARQPLSVSVGNHRHLCMHSYKLVEPDGPNGKKFKGTRTHEYAMLSPGMVFSLPVWEEGKIAEAFAEQQTDIKPFDLIAIELQSKSSAPSRSEYAKDARINILSVRQINTLAASSASWLPSRIFTTNVQDGAALLAHFTAGTHLSPAGLALRAPHGEAYVTDEDAGVAPLSENAIPREHVLQQSWISKQLASSLFAVRAVPSGGSFAIGPDDILRFHGEQSNILDLTGLQAPSFPVRYDEKLYTTNREWVVQLLNIGLFVGAVELLIAADTYSGGNSSENNNNISAFARIRQGPWSDVFFSKTPMAQLPPFIANYVTGPLRHIVAYELQPSAFHIVIDTRTGVNQASGKAPTLFGAFMPLEDESWERGHLLTVFIDEMPVFNCIAPIAFPGALAGSSASARGFGVLAAPPTLTFDSADDTDEAPAAAAAAGGADDAAAAAAKPAAAAAAAKRTKRPPSSADA
jgi:hypothetical protein